MTQSAAQSKDEAVIPSDLERKLDVAVEGLKVISEWRAVLRQLRDEASLHGYSDALESICDRADRDLTTIAKIKGE